MNALEVMMGLLLLAYLGSFVVGGKGSIATTSNVGWIALGVVLGPYALNVLGETLLEAVTPVVTIAAGWVAFATGVRVLGGADFRARREGALGLATGLVTAALAGGVAWLFLPLIGPLEPSSRVVLALTAAAITAGSDRDTSLGAKTPRTVVALAHVARAELVVAVLLAQVAVAFAARSPLRAIPLPFALSFTLALVSGPLLGAITVPLLGSELRLREGWGALLGMCALAVGLSIRFGVSVVWVLFSLGATLVRLSPHREEVRALVAPTERSLLLPLLVVVGARLDLGARLVVLEAALAIVVLRTLVHGTMLAGLFRDRKSAAFSGLASLPITPLSLVVAAAVSVRFREGPAALLSPVAVALAVLGEVVSPLALRAVHRRAPSLAEPEGEPS